MISKVMQEGKTGALPYSRLREMKNERLVVQEHYIGK